MRPCAVALAGSLVAIGLGVAAQQQTPTFRSRTDLARLDVTVIDNKTGKPIENLTERDFTVTENGARQTISTFATERLEPDPDAAKRATTPVRGADTLAPHTRRTFLFIVRPSTVKGADGPVKPLEGVSKFIREKLLPQDIVAVQAFNRFTVFTTDHEHVAQVIDNLATRAPQVMEDMRVDAFRRRYLGEWSREIQDKMDALLQPPGAAVPFFRSATSFLTATDTFKVNDNVSIPHKWNSLLMSFDLLKIYVGIEYLRTVEGEKHIVVLTPGLRFPIRILNMPEGLGMNDKDDEARLAARALGAQVAISIISTSGTAPAMRGNQTGSSSGSYVASLATLMGLQGLQHVPELTGGHFTSVRTAEQQLARIDEATRTGYIIGYMPTNPQLDGKYRKVDVKVNRPGVTVIARRGYLAQAELEPMDLRDVVTNSRIRDAAATDLEQDDIKLRAKASLERSSSGAAGQIKVQITIDAARLTLVQNGALREGSIDLAVLCGDTKQQVVGSLKQRMTLSLDEAHYRQAISSGIPYTATISLAGPATYVKVLVYDYGNDVLGVVNVPIR